MGDRFKQDRPHVYVSLPPSAASPPLRFHISAHTFSLLQSTHNFETTSCVFLKTIFLCSDVRYPQRLMITSVSIKMLMIRIPLIKNTTVTLHPGRSWSFGFPGYLPHKFWSKFRELQLHEQFRTDVNNLFFSCRLVTQRLRTPCITSSRWSLVRQKSPTQR